MPRGRAKLSTKSNKKSLDSDTDVMVYTEGRKSGGLLKQSGKERDPCVLAKCPAAQE
jgi:hypothetical protein